MLTGRGRCGVRGIVVGQMVCLFLLAVSSALGVVGPENVLILVNENSPTSRYIARLYREYHPEITDAQILSLSGLTDCSGPNATAADEIITRDQYDNLIAGPVRNYLSTATDLPGEVMVIITTAGMPYRIEDTSAALANVIYPGGSNPITVSSNLTLVNAASVESELTCLWYSDADSGGFGIANRMVNPYQGYRNSGIDLFTRSEPGTKSMLWNIAYSDSAPRIEGQSQTQFVPPFSFIFGITDRSFSPGDIYLTCRLDGPKNQGQSAVHAVREMLARACRASSPSYGVNPAQAVAVFDDSPSNLDDNRIHNVTNTADCLVFSAGQNQPPDVWGALMRDDYCDAFCAMTGAGVADGQLNIAFAGACLGVVDSRDYVMTSQGDLDLYAAMDPSRDPWQAVIYLASYGRNGDDPAGADYILAGYNGGPLFNVANGAVFSAYESFNAVTMFSDVATGSSAQGKIVDFLAIGGSAAIGHAFEPMADAETDNAYVVCNLLADYDGDGLADLTAIEAIFSGLPYLSWSEVVLADPLMRIAYGPGGPAWYRLTGDVNDDGRVSTWDYYYVRFHLGGILETTDEAAFALYDDLADVNMDGRVSTWDYYYVRFNLGNYR
ncbi:MAG: hypothetical protein JW936_06735 [Sedimentisphaerales bacterium]|nr:hypothetical protein [Sedimentisphaerales bacterium]